jgi:hypothetical protein
MPAQSLKILGRDFVLLPKREYDSMRAQLDRRARQDRGDVAEAKRRAKQRSIPLAEVRKRLGLSGRSRAA